MGTCTCAHLLRSVALLRRLPPRCLAERTHWKRQVIRANRMERQLSSDAPKSLPQSHNHHHYARPALSLPASSSSPSLLFQSSDPHPPCRFLCSMTFCTSLLPAFLSVMPKAAKRPHLTSASSSSKRSRLTAVAVSPNSPAKRIINSFQPDPFYPYLFSNPHFQTILAHLYPPPPHVVYHRILIRTDDAQAVVKVDIANGTSLAPVSSTPSPWFAESPISVPKSSSSSHTYEHFPSSPPVAVVLHGLESNSTSNVTLRIVHALTTQNFKVFALNYRACADTDQVPTTLRLYHAGFTEDLETLLRAIKNAAIHVKRRPPPVYICGFSLGANIVCNFLGHRASDATRLYNVVAAAAACVPFDPTSCQRKLDSGLRGAVYSARLVSTMQEKVEAAHRHGVDISPCLPEKLRAANRIGLIDEYFIAPVFGFKDRYDYYHQVRSSSYFSTVLRRTPFPSLANFSFSL